LVYLLKNFNPPCTYNKNRQASKQASKQTNKIQYPKTSTYQSLLLTYQEKFNPPHTHTHTHTQQQQHTSKQTYKTQNEYLQIPSSTSSSSSYLPRKIQSTLHTQPTTYKKPKKTQNEQNPKQVVTNPFFLPT
jgi:hypothetical protein